MQIVLFVLWIALGIAQIAAYLDGIHLWLGIGSFWGFVIFFFTMSLPLGAIIDAAIAFYGAYQAWHWPLWQAALLTFPFVILGFVVVGLEGATSLAGKIYQRGRA